MTPKKLRLRHTWTEYEQQKKCWINNLMSHRTNKFSLFFVLSLMVEGIPYARYLINYYVRYMLHLVRINFDAVMIMRLLISIFILTVSIWSQRNKWLKMWVLLLRRLISNKKITIFTIQINIRSNFSPNLFF